MMLPGKLLNIFYLYFSSGFIAIDGLMLCSVILEECFHVVHPGDDAQVADEKDDSEYAVQDIEPDPFSLKELRGKERHGDKDKDGEQQGGGNRKE